MLRRMRGLTALAALILLTVSTPLAAAGNSALVIIPVYDERALQPGESVNLSFLTFSNGQPCSVDSMLKVTVQPSNGVERAIAVRESSVGRYDGNYTLVAADASSWGDVSLRAEATRGRTSETDMEYDSASEYVYLTMDRLYDTGVSLGGYIREASSFPLKPGSSVVLECVILKTGAPFDPEGLQLSIRRERGVSPTPVDSERIAPGRYLVRYTIPALESSDTFRLQATYPGLSYERYVTTFTVDFFTVQYHQVKVSGTRVDFELLVSDRAGKPVNDTRLHLTLGPATGGKPSEIEPNRTDRNGRTKAFFDFGARTGSVAITGWANASGHFQYFSGSIALPWGSTQNYDYPNFQVKTFVTGGEKRPGGTIGLTCLALYDGVPMREQQVDCYVKTQEVLPAGSSDIGYYSSIYSAARTLSVEGFRKTTDAEGQFTMNLTFPALNSSYTRLVFRTPTGPSVQDSSTPLTFDGLSYSQDEVSFSAYAEPQALNYTEAKFSDARPGSALTVRATPFARDTVAVRASWAVSTNITGSSAPWQSWSTMVYNLPRKSGTDEFRGTVSIPKSLKAGTNITVTLETISASGIVNTSRFTRTLKAAAAAPSENADMCCFITIAVVNFMLVGYMVAQYMISRRAPLERRLDEMGADETIRTLLSESRMPDSYPVKVELAASADCAVCSRKIARGNFAYRCSCGKGFHEHCLGGKAVMPSDSPAVFEKGLAPNPAEKARSGDVDKAAPEARPDGKGAAPKSPRCPVCGREWVLR
jgi:hypothetical protein